MEDVKELKRKKILDVAFKLFSEKGYESTKISDIAVEAGIGKATVYEYFESKDALFCQTFRDQFLATYAELSKSISEEDSCENQLKTVLLFEMRNRQNFSSSKGFMPYIFSRTEKDNKNNNAFFSTMHELLEKKFQVMHSIICQGISKKEFKEMNPIMATTAIIGAINFYLMFQCNGSHHTTSFFNHEKDIGDIEELFSLIIGGLKR